MLHHASIEVPGSVHEDFHELISPGENGKDTYLNDCDNITGQVLSIDSLPVTAWWKLLLMESMFFQPECLYIYIHPQKKV